MSSRDSGKTQTTEVAPEVLAIGSLFLELTPEHTGQHIAEMDRLIPTASGAAANFALVLAALGHHVRILARVGADELGKWVRHKLQAAGIDTHGVAAVPGQSTPISFVNTGPHGEKQYAFYRFPGYCDPMAEFSLSCFDRSIIRQAKVLDFTEAAVRHPTTRQSAFDAARCCRQAGGRVVYAVNYRPQAWGPSLTQMKTVQQEAMALAHVVLLNEEEYTLIFDGRLACINSGDSPTIVVTAGERGGWVEKAGVREYFPARAVAVHYDVGAGDSFHAGYVAAYLEGQPDSDAVRFAAACAALKISRPPDARPPSRQEVIDYMT